MDAAAAGDRRSCVCWRSRVTSVLPSPARGHRRSQDDVVTEAPYALTPRIGDTGRRPRLVRRAGGRRRGRHATAQGDVYFVTVSEPQQSVLGWWAAGGDSCNRDLPPNVSRCSALPQIDVLTTRDKFGDQTPDREPADLVADDAHGVAGRPVRRPQEARLRGRHDRARCRRRQRPRARCPGGERARRSATPSRRSPARRSPTVDDLVDGADRQAAGRRGRRRDRPAGRGRDDGAGDADGEPRRRRAAPSSGSCPFDTRERAPAVRGEHRHRPDRRAVGRAGVHADADRRAVAGQPDRRRRRGRHGRDRPRRHGRRDRRAGPEGLRRAPGRGAHVPRADRPGPRPDRPRP